MHEGILRAGPISFGSLGRGIIRAMAGGHTDSSQEMTDEALAERVRGAGDTAAYAILVTRYRGRIVALARRMLCSSAMGSRGSAGGGIDEAEDVAQDTFVAAYDRRATFRRGEPFRPWLYRIAVNRCLDRLRAQARRPHSLSIENVLEIGDTRLDPLQTMLATERETRLQFAVSALPPKYRAIFLLRHVDDLSYEEIAVAADLPVGTVKTHLFRARAQLRQALEGYLDT